MEIVADAASRILVDHTQVINCFEQRTLEPHWIVHSVAFVDALLTIDISAQAGQLDFVRWYNGVNVVCIGPQLTLVVCDYLVQPDLAEQRLD